MKRPNLGNDKSSDASPDPDSQDATARNGVGRSTAAPAGKDQPGAGSATGSTPRAPWTTPDWEGDRTRALRRVESGDVPDEYRDLVRRYFEQ